jgi:hypothetical protein
MATTTSPGLNPRNYLPTRCAGSSNYAADRFTPGKIEGICTECGATVDLTKTGLIKAHDPHLL